MSEHTPGPWTTENVNHEHLMHDIICDYHVPGDGLPTLLATVFHDDDGPIDVKQANANARLIAAAPSLLAACKYLRRFLDEYDTGNELHPSLRQTLDAAIRQAEQQ